MKCPLVVMTACLLFAESAVQKSHYLVPPYGPANQLVSPDGAYGLFGGGGGESELWLEDRRSHERRKVFNVSVQTMSLAWSPGSTAFIANDRPTSDDEDSFLYNVQTLERVDLRKRIVAVDPAVLRFFMPGQIAPGVPAFPANARVPMSNHVFATRWLDAQHVEVEVVGHTGSSGTPDRIRTSQCFELRYRVSRTGEVKRLSRRVITTGSEAADKACLVIPSDV